MEKEKREKGKRMVWVQREGEKVKLYEEHNKVKKSDKGELSKHGESEGESSMKSGICG